MFSVHARHFSGARRGEYTSAHGTVQTPLFMPIATQGTVKTLASHEVWDIEQSVDAASTPIVLSNTYHLFLRPGEALLRTMGGLHQFMDWNGVILTDSGGFQVFSLARLRTIRDEGVEFHSHIDGATHLLTPERSMEIQSVIGADIWMAFDYFPGYPASSEEIQQSVALTTAWAKRSRVWHQQYLSEHPQTQHALFGIVQGSTDDALRRESAEQLLDIGFEGYAFGGLAVGEPVEEMIRVLDNVEPLLPQETPRYLMGVGFPEQILEAVKRGVDFFDCVLPTRNARHGTLFVHTPDRQGKIVEDSLAGVSYVKLNIRAESWSQDPLPLDPLCTCSVCQHGYSRAYIRHLFSVHDPVASRLATIHNLHFYMQLMKEIRDAITL